MVLLNAKVPAESEVQIAAFLRSVRERFGRPAAISCDMSRGILAAVAAELRGVPVYLCHFHFLRDLGKDLLGPDYAVIRDRLRNHGVKAGLKRLRRDLKDTVGADAERLRKLIEHAAQADPGTINARDIPYEALVGILAGAVLVAEHEGDGCGFPFDRPHLLFFRQAGTVLRTIEALRDAPRLPDVPRRLFARLAGLLAPLCADRVLCTAAAALETQAELFDRLRTAMRLAEPGGRTGLNDDGADTPMSTVMKAVERLCEEVRNDKALMRNPRAAAMLEQIDTRREHLFAGPITLMTPAGPRLLQPQRTNNILERLFRSVNRATCRRVGRPAGEIDINRMPVDIPLLGNLDNPLYLEAVLDGASSLAERLSRVDRKILDDTLADLHRPEAGLNRKLRARMRRRATPLQIALLILTRAA